MCELSFRRNLQENAPKEEMVLMILDTFVIEDVIEEETLSRNADACKLTLLSPDFTKYCVIYVL